MKKNMKIEINKDQPLNEVVVELERLGYVKQAWLNHQKEVIATFETVFILISITFTTILTTQPP